MTEVLRTANDVLESIARRADREGIATYLVGGAVRDRLRRRRVRDLDVAVEGDAVSFAREWARLAGGRLAASSEFGTAAVEFPSGDAVGRVDFSRTRSETYAFPAALPSVRPSGIEEDLARRDFTVNAMAIPLNGPSAGQLLDPHGGRRDLERGLVRMLHPESPRDDPTRAFRAVRFALRLGYRVAPATRRWIAAALRSGAFTRLSGDRLRRELFLLFEEQAPARAVAAMGSLGILPAIGPSLTARAGTLRRLDRLRELGRRVGRAAAGSGAWSALLCWSLDLHPQDREAAARRLGLTGKEAREFARLGDRVARAREEAAGDRLSGIAALSRDWTIETLLAVASALPSREASRLLRARTASGRVRLTISGEDLRRSGVSPGPAIGRALERTWRARVDRRIAASEELPYALSEVNR